MMDEERKVRETFRVEKVKKGAEHGFAEASWREDHWGRCSRQDDLGPDKLLAGTRRVAESTCM